MVGRYGYILVYLQRVGTNISRFTYDGLGRISLYSLPGRIYPSLTMMGWYGYLLVYLQRVGTENLIFTYDG